MDVCEAELVGNSCPYSGSEEDLLKVTAPACSVHAPSPPALVSVTLAKMSNIPVSGAWQPQDPASLALL